MLRFKFSIHHSCVYLRSCLSYRYLRSVANRYPRLLKGKVVTKEIDMENDFAAVEDYDLLDRNLKKMFNEPGDFQSEAELSQAEDLNVAFVKEEKMYDIYSREDGFARQKVRRSIISNRYFKQPKETSLLTWAAKQQIHYLHRLDPKEWTPEKLSECFPVSVPGVKKLLKNVSNHQNEERIRSHDEEVARRWKLLKSGENLESISPVTLKLWKEGKLVQDYYSGNVDLPRPPEPDYVEWKTKPKKTGEYLAIVKKYLDVKKKKMQEENKMPNVKSAEDDSKLKQEIKDIQENILPQLKLKYPSKSEHEDQVSASYVATSNIDYLEPSIPVSQFEQNLREEFSAKKNKEPADIAYFEWMEKNASAKTSPPMPPEHSVIDSSVSIKKFGNNIIELRTERNKDRQTVAYLYDPDVGYQYPMGGSAVQNYIKIPYNLYKKGALYRLGRSFYDDSGQFLYRLPFEIKS